MRPSRLGPDKRPEIRLPKGHVEPGESPYQAAIREVCEEAGLLPTRVLADLGHQVVEFDWQGAHYVRSERYYLMLISRDDEVSFPEKQFKPLWLSWEKALGQLTFEAEREWVRRARTAWLDHQATKS
jgi:8-oxo-dGTP pyrophosphatase MutT (NUDIX family)